MKKPSVLKVRKILYVIGLELAPKDALIIAACERLGLKTVDQAFIEAERLPPDMQGDLEFAVSLYREFKSRGPS
jgi:hypothetical protein